jgi:uncharacterized membrane protein YcaP (DUF421 family)
MTVDWHALFVPHHSPIELVLRGSIMYLGLFAVLRVVVRREVGSIKLTDLLLIVLIADASQNAMAGDYTTITEGALLCGTLVGWSYLLDWLAYRFPLIRRLVEPRPLPLIRDGRLLRQNMKKEMVTEEELSSHLRQQGCEHWKEVRLAHIEPDGEISIIKYDSRGESGKPNRKKAP